MKLIIITSAVFLLTLNVRAQQSSNGFANPYLQSSIHKEAIHTGKEYARYPFYINRGIPYYRADSLASGKVMFNGVLHENIRLMYDQTVDELITTDLSGAHLIMLVKAKVKYFTLFNDSFILISTAGKNLIPGYYRVLYNGRMSLLKKEDKSIVDEVVPNEQLKKNIVVKSKFYLQQNGEYNLVTSVAATADLLDKTNNELKDFIKKNRKHFKKTDLGEALKEVLAYYDQLTK